MQLVVASSNQGKLREIRAMTELLGIEVLSAAELGFTQEIEETGETFEANARLKAQAVSQALGQPALADDSGLAVDALGGRPGVHSARYAGPGASDAERSSKLLAELDQVPDAERGAAFVCVMACCRPDGRFLISRGELRGTIARAPAGHNGFGYDPVFFLPDRGLTVAQISADDKNAISHRGRALRDMVARLPEFLRTE